MRWALLVLFLKLIAFVAIWVGVGIWFKTAPPPSISKDERLFNQVTTLVTAGVFSALLVLIDRKNVWQVAKTSLVVGLCAAAGFYAGKADFTQGGFVGALLGALIGFIVTQWYSRKPASFS